MAYKQKTPMLHCAATVMHSKSWNKMRNRTAAVAGRGDGNKVGLAHAEKMRKTPLAKKETLKDVAGQLRKASKMHLGQAKVVEKHIEEMKDTPLKKQKGGGTRKVCLPAAKVRSMSKEAKEKVIRAKESAASQGKYKRSSKSNVKGARKKGATLRDWFEKENWINVKTGEPCGK